MNKEESNQEFSFQISQFQTKIFDWWEKHKRTFPWRETTDPYRIMVSEFMLQQTQASRVVPKYLEFIEAFPAMKTLARAPLGEVLKHWSGLGYNRRAIWLKEAAQIIGDEKAFPRDPRKLKSLKGIGEYTSRSILIFAFNMDLAAVDTNIRRIFVYHGFATEETTPRQLQIIAEQLLPKGKARDWHNALMDYGALQLPARRTSIRSRGKSARFKGSRREKRGKILRQLVKTSSLSIGELAQQISLSLEETWEIVRQLENEGFILVQSDHEDASRDPLATVQLR